VLKLNIDSYVKTPTKVQEVEIWRKAGKNSSAHKHSSTATKTQQHGDHNTTQHNTTQHNTTQHNTTQHIEIASPRPAAQNYQQRQQRQHG